MANSNGQHGLRAANYRRVEALCGDLSALPGFRRSRLKGNPVALVLQLVEETPLKAELLLYNQQQDQQADIPPEPLFHLVISHDRRTAMTISVRDTYGYRSVEQASTGQNPQAIERLNQQLGIWLEHMLVLGHSLKAGVGH